MRRWESETKIWFCQTNCSRLNYHHEILNVLSLRFDDGLMLETSAF